MTLFAGMSPRLVRKSNISKTSIVSVKVVAPRGSASRATAGPLGNAAKAGDIAEIERLLDEGADVNERGLATPLFYAIQAR